jgi:hypothetical protein
MFNLPSSSLFKSFIAAAAVVAQTAFATPVNFSGALTASDPVFNRPVTATTLSFTGTRVSYDVYGFHVSANGTYSIEATSFASNGIGLPADTFFALYRTAFNPATPLANLVQVDDDSGAGNMSLLNSSLLAGTQYYLIFTSFTNGVFGSYTGRFDTVSGGGQVALDGATVPGQVPEPATLALLPLALLGMTLARRRQRR